MGYLAQARARATGTRRAPVANWRRFGDRSASPPTTRARLRPTNWKSLQEPHAGVANASGRGARSACSPPKNTYPEAVAIGSLSAGSAPLSDEGYQWKVRAALRAHDWSMVLATGIQRNAGRQLAAQARMGLLAWPCPARPAACTSGSRRAVREDRRPGQLLRQPGRRGTRAQASSCRRPKPRRSD